MEDLPTLLTRGESLTLEFKRQVNDRDLVEAAVCMANGQGGTILIGVTDDGRVTGAAPRHGDSTDPDRLAATIQNHTDPPLPVEVHLEHHQSHEVVRVTVPLADPGPVGTKRGLFVKRVIAADGKPACVGLTPQELVSRAQITRGIDPATAPAAGATTADLDPAQFQRFRQACKASGGDGNLAELGDVDICKALGLVPRDHPVSLGMILLFGRVDALRKWVPTAEVLFQDARTQTGTNLEFRLPLFEAWERIHELLEVREVTTEVMVGVQRIDVPVISRMTRRESVANALVHRDYSVLGPAAIRISETEFTVSSPGGFPPGVTASNILEQSRPRSVVLADAFKRAGLVERRGKGVNQMFESQLRAGRELPSYALTTADSVVLSVPLGTTDLELVRFLAASQHESQSDLSLDQLRVVHEIKAAGALTSSELAEFLTMAPSIARTVANSLVERGVLEARGHGRNRRYHLTARFYDLAQDRAAYVRVKHMDPLQQEQMVMAYVSSFGRITRSEVADLCQVNVSEARRLLKSLTENGRLELRGSRRGSHYVLPESPGQG